MCTVLLATRVSRTWPLLLAANRDERLARPWSPPAAHWPDQPNVIAGQDRLAGGTWLGLNQEGVVAAVLNRTGSLGPAPGKRSRGELPLLALKHPTAHQAAHAIAALDAGFYRSFNLLIADRKAAYFLRGIGEGRITSHPLPPGLHMVTAQDPNDPASPRTARHLPKFRATPIPNPPDWSTWPTLLADHGPPLDSALNVPPTQGFGTTTSTLLALGPIAHFCTTPGPPGTAAFQPVPLW
jgi:hypothetical protein